MHSSEREMSTFLASILLSHLKQTLRVLFEPLPSLPQSLKAHCGVAAARGHGSGLRGLVSRELSAAQRRRVCCLGCMSAAKGMRAMKRPTAHARMTTQAKRTKRSQPPCKWVAARAASWLCVCDWLKFIVVPPCPSAPNARQKQSCCSSSILPKDKPSV